MLRNFCQDFSARCCLCRGYEPAPPHRHSLLSDKMPVSWIPGLCRYATSIYLHHWPGSSECIWPNVNTTLEETVSLMWLEEFACHRTEGRMLQYALLALLNAAIFFRYKDLLDLLFMMQRYRHKPLPEDSPAAHPIRILTLHPGRQGSPIHCEVNSVTLELAEPYDALSYAWGDSKVTKAITVSGRSLRITINLESALRHLRNESEPRRLWIDAICIDQNNDIEKSRQVLLMPKIYKRASKVLAWMGEASAEDELAFDMLEQWQKDDEQFPSRPRIYLHNIQLDRESMDNRKY